MLTIYAIMYFEYQLIKDFFSDRALVACSVNNIINGTGFQIQWQTRKIVSKNTSWCTPLTNLTIPIQASNGEMVLWSEQKLELFFQLCINYIHHLTLSKRRNLWILLTIPWISKNALKYPKCSHTDNRNTESNRLTEN